jgi:hypothetical protein
MELYVLYYVLHMLKVLHNYKIEFGFLPIQAMRLPQTSQSDVVCCLLWFVAYCGVLQHNCEKVCKIFMIYHQRLSFYFCETFLKASGHVRQLCQEVAQLHDRYMMIMMMIKFF